MDTSTKQTLTILGVGVLAFLGVKYFLKNRDEQSSKEPKITKPNPKPVVVSSFSGADGGCGCGG